MIARLPLLFAWIGFDLHHPLCGDPARMSGEPMEFPSREAARITLPEIAAT